MVRAETAGLGTRRVRRANLPSEVPEEVIRTIMARYGEVKDVQAETWARLYRYKVANGVRIEVMTLAKHIPSNITIAGHRALVSYEGQPMKCYRCPEKVHFHQACPMRRKTGEIGHNAAATSCVDITARGAGATRRDREAVEEGEQRRVHTLREENESGRESEIHADEEESRHPGGQGLRHIPGQEEIGRSDTIGTVTPQTSAPTPATEIQMEREGVRQEKGTAETRYRAPITKQHVQHEGNQSDVEEEGSGEESVVTVVCCEVDTPAPIDAELLPAAQPTRPKRPKKLKLDGRESPPRERSRSRVRSVFKKV